MGPQTGDRTFWGDGKFCNLIMVVVTRVYTFLNLIELYVNSSSIKLIFKSVQNLDKARLGLRISPWASRGLIPSP